MPKVDEKTLLALREKIENLKGKEDEIYVKNLTSYLEALDFNLLFRNLCTRSSTLPIIQFLYENKAAFQLDINAQGANSKKTGLEVAIEREQAPLVVYLLKLEELEVSVELTKKMIDKFGHQLRTQYISPTYTPLMNQLVDIKKQVEKQGETYQARSASDIQRKKNALEEIWARRGSMSSQQLREHVLKILLESLAYCTEQTGALFELQQKYEQLMTEFLPNSLAFDRLLLGNEYTAGNRVHSIKYICLYNRKVIVDLRELIENNLRCLVESTEHWLKFFHLFSQRNIFQSEKANLETKTITSSDKKSPEPTHAEHVVAAAASVAEEPQPPVLETLRLPVQALPAIEQALDMDVEPSTAIEDRGLSLDAEDVETTDDLNTELQSVLEELQALKQKGKVKLKAFMAIIQDFSKFVHDLNVTETKKGYLVSRGSHKFSFHRPHGKGASVDKKTLADLKDMMSSGPQ